MYNQIIPDNLFRGNTTFDKYYIAKFFKEFVMQKEYFPYQFNSWSENKNYGIYDGNKNVIYPKQDYLKEYKNNLGVQHRNISFVADAFFEMKSFQENLLRTVKRNNISIYSKLNVVESTVDAPNLYLTYLQKVYTIFSNTFLVDENKKNIKDINTFMLQLINFFKIFLKAARINRSSFMGGKYVPNSINGLRISFDNPTDLSIKNISNTYIGSIEFEKFVEIAAYHGFKVDKSAPWSMIADLESPNMLKYMKSAGVTRPDEVFEKMYFKAYTVDLESLKNVILSFWNSFAATNGTLTKITEAAKCSNLFIEVSEVNQLDIKTFENHFNVNWQLRMYAFTRILEERLNITQNKFDNLCSEMQKINKYYDTEKALLFINEKIQELHAREKKNLSELTSPDAVVKLLSSQVIQLPTEGINF